ncbi:hypothetical protein A6X21_18455 [Planctopirus hydrillae]|uniref:Uncharacterized protein n=1 Tax=Planctopirus hydrillae TaxID=1841610 RepID=A0A1C3EKF0_9PLAN|nr:hypothetical protein A6X21_18455 [Planctopirus hydrillae]
MPLASLAGKLARSLLIATMRRKTPDVQLSIKPKFSLESCVSLPTFPPPEAVPAPPTPRLIPPESKSDHAFIHEKPAILMKAVEIRAALPVSMPEHQGTGRLKRGR